MQAEIPNPVRWGPASTSDGAEGGRNTGTSSATGTADEAETELERRIWLGEDQESWTGGETVLSGTIGGTLPRHDEAKAEDTIEETEEPDILDPERLQELLDDIIIPKEKTEGDSLGTAGKSAGLLDGLGLGLGLDEVNDIDRLLNG